MNEEEFITKFYSCDNEEQFLKDVNHNLNCLQKVQNNWNELKKWLEEHIEFLTECDKTFLLSSFKKEIVAMENILNKMQELEGNNE